jgi:Spy/CpxP family protein refolding chaperone
MTSPPVAVDPGQKPAMEGKCEAGSCRGDMMGANFFCPELVMRYQKDLGLTPDQQKTIKSEMVKFAEHKTELRWDQSIQKGMLADLLKEAKPDEKAILAQTEKVLKIENDLKLSTLGMLIGIKNALTPEQQTKMSELQKHLEHHHPWRGHMMQHAWGGRMMGHGPMGFPGGPPPANPPANPQ